MPKTVKNEFKDELKQKLDTISYLQKQVNIWKQKLKVANSQLTKWLDDTANPNNQVSLSDLEPV